MLRVWEVEESRGRERVMRIRAKFKYTAAGSAQEEEDTLPDTWEEELVPGQMITVEYLPYREKSARLAENRAWGAIWIFSALTLALVLLFGKTRWEVRQTVNTPATWKKKSRGGI